MEKTTPLNELEERVLAGLAAMKPLKQIARDTNRDLIELTEIIASACSKLDSNSISNAVAMYSGRTLACALEDMRAVRSTESKDIDSRAVAIG